MMSHLINRRVQINLAKLEVPTNHTGRVALPNQDMAMILTLPSREAHRIQIGQICRRVRTPIQKLTLPIQDCLLLFLSRSRTWVPCF